MIVWLLAGYLLLLAAVTLICRTRRHGQLRDDRSFYVARGSLSTFTTACSLTATSVGGSSTVITAALVYQHGLAGIWMDLAGCLGYLLLGLLLARSVRRTGVCSMAELVGLRYGPGVRRAVALVVVLAELAWLALLARSLAAVLAPALPMVAPWQLMAAALVVVVLYTVGGGQFAVSYTDVVQILVMVVGLCVLAPLASARAVGAEQLAALRWDFPVSSSFGWSQVGSFLVLTGLPHMVGSDIYAKVLSARDGRTARAGALLAALLKVMFAMAIAFVALCGTRLLGPLERPDQLLALVIEQTLPAPMAALVIVAMVATLMSSADQVLLSAVTMVGNDLLPGRAVIRPSALLFGLLAWCLAWLFPSVIDLMKVAYTVFASGLALPVLASIPAGLKLPRTSVLASILAGGATGGGLHIAKLLGLTLPADPVIWGVSVSLLCLVARGRSKKTKKTPPEFL